MIGAKTKQPHHDLPVIPAGQWLRAGADGKRTLRNCQVKR
jgi:hypothetical protein